MKEVGFEEGGFYLGHDALELLKTIGYIKLEAFAWNVVLMDSATYLGIRPLLQSNPNTISFKLDYPNANSLREEMRNYGMKIHTNNLNSSMNVVLIYQDPPSDKERNV